MRKLMLALVMMFALTMPAIAAETKGPAIESQSITVDNGRLNMFYLQDGDSFKPGFAWSRGIYPEHPRVTFNWAVTYDTNNVEMTCGPMLGYKIVDDKYFSLTPVVGVLQDFTGKGNTRFAYGISASVDVTSLMGQYKNPNAAPRLMSVKPTKSMGGFSALALYGDKARFGAGIGYTLPITKTFGVTPLVSVQMPATGKDYGAGIGAGLSYQFYADSKNSFSAMGGVLYNTEQDNVSPVVGVQWTGW